MGEPVVFHAMLLRASTVQAAGLDSVIPADRIALRQRPQRMKEGGFDGTVTDSEYTDMVADYAANPLRSEEVAGPVEMDSAVLRNGRPAGTTGGRGRTPTTSVRLPDTLREQFAAQASAEDVAPAEVIRRALVEYFAHHQRPA